MPVGSQVNGLEPVPGTDGRRHLAEALRRVNDDRGGEEGEHHESFGESHLSNLLEVVGGHGRPCLLL